jgi:predicted glycosyltransferase involved in capsule biosynthesis
MKRFLWFLFRSPQRKIVGWKSLWVDLAGFISLIRHRLFASDRSEIIWICVGNKNRSEALLNYLIPSLTKLNHLSRFGLSVVDCNSSDVADLEGKLKQHWQGQLVFSSHDIPFSRAAVFNLAITQAPGDLVFVCDADMSLSQNIADLIDKNTTKKTAWFPICQWQLSPDEEHWKWFTAGTGIFSAYKHQLQKTGLYNEAITAWGKEDWDLFFRFYQKGIMPLRSRCQNLYHHWHVSEKPGDYVNMF